MSYTRFLLSKGLTLGLTAILALSATILIAGFGGTIDKMIVIAIERETRQEVGLQEKYRGLTAEQRERVINQLAQDRIAALGIDKPFISRFPGYLMSVLTLDLGSSWFFTSDSGSRRVVDIVAEKLPRTILLFTSGSLLSLALGIPLGMLSARRALGILDRSVTSFALVTNALPLWWIGMLMIIALSFHLKLLPAGGFVGVPPPSNPIHYALDVGYHMILPLLAILVTSVGGTAYVVRNMVVRIFQEDFIMAERARGLPERLITFRHALRVASPPIATIVGFSILGSTGGALISEVVFNWPGMGRLYWDAISFQDVPLIVGLTYITIVLYVLLIFILDVAYGFLDPRVKVAPGPR